MKPNLYVTILAGGMGKRMKSSLPKVLHKVNNVPMIVRIIKQVQKLNIAEIIIVVGKFKNIISDTIDLYINQDNNIKITYIIQENPLGTGHAILCTLDYLVSLNYLNNNNSYNLILNGDTPMLQYDTLNSIINNFVNNNYDLQITSIETQEPSGCGRIILDNNNNNKFIKIVEEKDCTSEQRNIKLINCGIYVAKINILRKYVRKITNDNIQQEYYLTDLVELYIKHNKNNNIGLFTLESNKENEIININTREQLDKLNGIIN